MKELKKYIFDFKDYLLAFICDVLAILLHVLVLFAIYELLILAIKLLCNFILGMSLPLFEMSMNHIYLFGACFILVLISIRHWYDYLYSN